MHILIMPQFGIMMMRTCLDEVIAAVRRVNPVFISQRYQTMMQQMACRWSNK